MACANGSGIAPGASGRLACATATPNTITMSAKPPSSEQPSPTPAVRVQYRQGQNDEQQENERPDQTRHQRPAVKADFPKSPERGHHESADIDPGAEQLALRDR